MRSTAAMDSLWDAAAEALALRSGRPKSQEKADLFPVDTAGPGWRCLHDHALRYHKRRGWVCEECDER
jgi:hypothetical protein